MDSTARQIGEMVACIKNFKFEDVSRYLDTWQASNRLLAHILSSRT
jgi:hypothetical protein